MALHAASLQLSEMAANRLAEAIAHSPRQTRKTHATGACFGNQSTLRMLSKTAPHLQCKLEIGAANDPLEAEADRIAEQVMRMPDPQVASSPAALTLRRKCACEDSGTPCESCAAANGERLQRKSAGAHKRIAPPVVHEVLRSAGRPLDPVARAFFEPRLGRDLSAVCVHSDATANHSARAVNALAYTVGRHIVLRDSGNAAQAGAAHRLLGHELAHVIQQDGSSTPSSWRDSSAPPAETHPGLPVLSNPNRTCLHRQGDDDDQGSQEGGDRDAQVECVKRLGGCANTRPGGIPTPEEIADYNQRCRAETHYRDTDVTPSDDECRGTAPATPPVPADAYICGRALNYPALNLLFNHTYISAPPANYGIVAPLCTPTDGGWNNLLLGTAARKRDDSCDPGALTPDCIPCRAKQGVSDVKQCLRDAFDAYNSPTLHKALGPNSNTFAYTLAKTCCSGITTTAPFMGWTPGWGDPPAPTRPATCPGGPADCS